MVKKTTHICPTCHTKGPRSARMQLASLNCCLHCFSFVRAAKAPKPPWFLDDALVLDRRKSNPRFPRASAELMQEVVKATQSQGEHGSGDIVDTLNKILKELNERLLREVCQYNFYSSTFDLLRVLDELYCGAASAERRVAQKGIQSPAMQITRDTKEIVQKTGMIGQPLELVIEIALANGSGSPSSPCTKRGLFELFELAYEMAQVHYCVESFLCLWKRGTLRVSDSGWHFEPKEEDQNRSQNLLENLATERSQENSEALSIRGGKSSSTREFQEAIRELRRGACEKPTKLGDDLDEFILAIDGAHRDQFGHSFTERLLALSCLGQSSTELPEDWAFEEKVVAFLRKQLEIEEETAHSILNILALTGEAIAQEKVTPFLFRRKFRLMRRPLPKLALV